MNKRMINFFYRLQYAEGLFQLNSITRDSKAFTHTFPSIFFIFSEKQLVWKQNWNENKSKWDSVPLIEFRALLQEIESSF